MREAAVVVSKTIKDNAFKLPFILTPHALEGARISLSKEKKDRYSAL
jgi:hypothetical protein